MHPTAPCPCQAPAWLLTVPGASRTVLEVRVPYATGSLAAVLGGEPKAYASAETALEMAKAAFCHAADLSPFGADIVGIGCTCALATDRSKRGEHKVGGVRRERLPGRSFAVPAGGAARCWEWGGARL